MKPFEVLGIALACGVFVLLIVLLTIKDIVFALVFGGAAMVVVLLVLALLLLGYRPNPEAPVYLDREIPGFRGSGSRSTEAAPAESPASEPAEPAESAEPAEPAEPADSAEPADPADPAAGDTPAGN